MLTKQQVEALIRERLAHNNSPGYGITVVDISPDARNIDIDLRFLSGRTYCCAEPGCHLPNDLARLPALADFTIRWHCIVERGARLKCNEVLRLPLEDDGYQYDYVIGESAEPDP
jgi:hypothetical protein